MMQVFEDCFCLNFKSYKEPSIIKKPLIRASVGLFILIIISNIINQFEYSNEIFIGGDFLYHIVQVIMNIISQLAYSLIAAVVFYFTVEIIQVKKKYKKILEAESILSSAEYFIAKILNILGYSQVGKPRIDIINNDLYETLDSIRKMDMDDFYKAAAPKINDNLDEVTFWMNMIKEDLDLLKNIVDDIRIFYDIPKSVHYLEESFKITERNISNRKWNIDLSQLDKDITISRFLDIVFIFNNLHRQIYNHNRLFEEGKYISCIKYY